MNEVEDMKSGETREYLGKTYKAVARPNKKGCCDGCDLLAKNPPICAPSDAYLGRCSSGFRKDGLPIIFKLVTVFALLLCLVSCTTPRYSRTVSRVYDAKGALIQTVVTDGIQQDDPNNHMLNRVFENQNFEPNR